MVTTLDYQLLPYLTGTRQARIIAWNELMLAVMDILGLNSATVSDSLATVSIFRDINPSYCKSISAVNAGILCSAVLDNLTSLISLTMTGVLSILKDSMEKL